MVGSLFGALGLSITPLKFMPIVLAAALHMPGRSIGLYVISKHSVLLAPITKFLRPSMEDFKKY